MSKRLQVGSMMFIPELMGALMRAMRDGQTVVECAYGRPGEGYRLEFEMRVTRVNDLRMPATRGPVHEKVFKERVVELNARDLIESKGARRRQPPAIAQPARSRKR